MNKLGDNLGYEMVYGVLPILNTSIQDLRPATRTVEAARRRGPKYPSKIESNTIYLYKNPSFRLTLYVTWALTYSRGTCLKSGQVALRDPSCFEVPA